MFVLLTSGFPQPFLLWLNYTLLFCICQAFLLFFIYLFMTIALKVYIFIVYICHFCFNMVIIHALTTHVKHYFQYISRIWRGKNSHAGSRREKNNFLNDNHYHLRMIIIQHFFNRLEMVHIRSISVV